MMLNLCSRDELIIDIVVLERVCLIKGLESFIEQKRREYRANGHLLMCTDKQGALLLKQLKIK